MRIIPLSEGSFTIDHTKEFVPFDLHKDDLQQRPLGSLLVEIQPFVIETGTDVILIDAGLGFCNEDNVLQLHENLVRHHIDPLSITKVMMSHLHKDHAGGLLKYDKQLQRYFPAFPQAVHYINRHEMDFALQPGNASYKPELLKTLNNAVAVVLLEDQGVLDGYIHYEVTAAHSPHHMVFTFKKDNQLVFFGGDDAPQLQQMKSRFVAKYDFDGKKAMQLRSAWWEAGQKEHWTFLFYHDIKTPMITL